MATKYYIEGVLLFSGNLSLAMFGGSSQCQRVVRPRCRVFCYILAWGHFTMFSCALCPRCAQIDLQQRVQQIKCKKIVILYRVSLHVFLVGMFLWTFVSILIGLPTDMLFLHFFKKKKRKDMNDTCIQV